MGIYLAKNNASSLLAGSVASGATSLSVAVGTGDEFPVVTGTDFTYLFFRDSIGNFEAIKVTARALGSDTMSIVKAQLGTSARSWLAGDLVECCPEASQIQDTINHLTSTADAHAASAITNTPSGSVSATTVQDAINELDASMIGTEGAAVAAAATCNIWALDGTTRHITGASGPITSFGTAPHAGAFMRLIFDSTPILVHSANLNLNAGGANITIAADDMAFVYADTTTQFDVFVIRKCGAAALGANSDITSMTGLTTPTAAANPIRANDVLVQLVTKFTAGGTADAITGALAPVIAAYANGQKITTTPPGANTITAPTINLSAIGAKKIFKGSLSGSAVALASGDYNASRPFNFEYNTSLDSAAGGWWLLDPLIPAGIPAITTAGSSDTFTAAPTPAIVGNTLYARVQLHFHTAPVVGPTLNISSKGALPIGYLNASGFTQWATPAQVPAAGWISDVVNDGTNWVLLNVASNAAYNTGSGKGIFGYGQTGGALSMTNIVSTFGVVATDVTGVGTARSFLAATGYGGDKAIFGYGGTYLSMTNLVSNMGVVTGDVAGVGTVRRALAAACYGGDKGIFAYGSDGSYLSVSNLVSNAGVVATDVTGVGTARQQLAAASYGNDKAIFSYGSNAGYLSLSNLVSNAGVVATDVTGVGTERNSLAAAGYGNDKAIFGYGTGFVTNLVSNVGIVASDVAGVGTSRFGLAATGYGCGKAIFGYGRTGLYINATNSVSSVGVVASDVTCVGTGRENLAAAGFSLI